MSYKWRRWRRWWAEALILFGAFLLPTAFGVALISLAAGFLGLFHRLMDQLRRIDDQLERIDAAIPNFDINGDMIR